MGFKVKPRTYKLVFEDEEYAGAVVRATSFSTAEMLELEDLQERAQSGDSAALRSVFVRIVDRIIDWNLEDENGEDLPVSMESMYALDFHFVGQMITALGVAIAGVPAPLERRLTSGGTSLEQSIPMETL